MPDDGKGEGLTQRALAYVFGHDADGLGGRQKFPIERPQATFAGRGAGAGTGPETSLDADQALAILDLGNAHKSEVAAANVALAADAGAAPGQGMAALAWLQAAIDEDAAAVRAMLTGLGLAYFQTPPTEGQQLVAIGPTTTTTEIASTPGINIAASFSDILDGTAGVVVTTEQQALLTTPYPVTQSAGNLAINWDDGHGLFRLVTSSQSFLIASSNLPSFVMGRLRVQAGGSHTITFPTGSKVHPAANSTGLALTSGQEVTISFQYTGSTLDIFISPIGATV